MKYLQILGASLMGLTLVASASAQTGALQVSVEGNNASNLKIEAVAISADGSDAEVKIETKTTSGSSGSSQQGRVITDNDSNEKEDGDEDRPVVIGTLPNNSSSGVVTSVSAETQGTDSARIRIINKIITPGTQAASGYLKIGDIKGESTEAKNASSTSTSTKKGNIEYSWKVEEGESAKKPKEIVVVGSKVRGWDPETKEEVLGAAPQSSMEVKNEVDFTFLMVKLVADDENIDELLANEDKLRIQYNFPARFLWFFPASLKAEASVKFGDGEQGRIPSEVKVKFPWYKFLYQIEGGVDVDETRVSIEEDLNIAEIELETEISARARTLQTISNVMKAAHDVAMSSVRNIK